MASTPFLGLEGLASYALDFPRDILSHNLEYEVRDSCGPGPMESAKMRLCFFLELIVQISPLSSINIDSAAVSLNI